MKRSNKIILTVIILAVLGGIAFFIFRKKEQPPQVVTVMPEYGNITNSVMSTGTIQPEDTVNVGTQVSGTIKRIYVDNNSVVRKGQLLAEIDQSLLLAQLSQINANLQQAKSNLTYQQSNFSRQKQLYEAGAISRADYEAALNQYEVAQDNVKGITAQISSANTNLSYTKIFSPIDGTVLLRNVAEGQTVAASFSTPTLFSLAKDLTKMVVRASVDEADIGSVKAGQHTVFSVDAFPNDTFSGTVKEILLSPTVNANVVTYSTLINAPNNDLKLKPGMTANITIYVKEKDSVMLIPVKATRFTPDAATVKKLKLTLVPGNGGGTKDHSGRRNHADNADENGSSAQVWVQKGNTLTEKQIKTGMTDDVNLEVISGLSPEDKVVTEIVETEQVQQDKTGERSPFMPQRRKNNKSGGKK